ncbi:hypothetical protein ACHAXR_002624 [Thalassiosira sp. AJA248-18]
MVPPPLTRLFIIIANVSTAAAFSSFIGTGTVGCGGSDGARVALPVSMNSARRGGTPLSKVVSSHHRRRHSGIGSSSTIASGRTTTGSSTRLQSTSASQLYTSTDDNNPFLERRERIIFEVKTLIRVLLPATLSGLAAFMALPAICFRVANFVTRVTDPAKIGMLGDAVGNFISLVGLLYSILVGQVFGFLYSQQEALYYALFDEVTEAKSLLEQVALVSQGRTMYSTCLNSIARYVKDDLLGGTLTLPPDSSATSSAPTSGKKKKRAPSTPSVTPSLILSARPADDPLEAILYLTSVGIPGQVYDTVRSLRQARSRRLGALQRKVPVIHLIMLWILGLIMMMSFPVLVGVGGAAAAGGQLYTDVFPWSGYKVMTLQGGLFGVATFAVVMTKMVLGELWRTKGGAYNVDAVLRVMVRGLQKELDERMAEAKKILKRSKEE